jgi:tubulin polyglutamylase TTLL6/13
MSYDKQATLTPTRKQMKKLIINTFNTQYEIITEIAKSFNWRIKLTEDEEDESDVYWVDFAVQPERFCKLKPYQKINHFPNMHELARKNFLAKNLNKMKKLFPNEYDFYPKTWLYPAELPALKLNHTNKAVYIVKPEASCQGKGIFLTRNLEGFEENERYVIQEYLKNPLLIDGLKFDLRIYVLVAGCDPLKIFIHKEGLARFATDEYFPPTPSNFSNPCMHLTNYAINKTSENFIFNHDSSLDNVGHKQSLQAAFAKIEKKGFSVEKLWKDIKGIVVKTIASVQPSLSHVYKACQPDDPYNGMCFELLGYDIILDETGKPWLLEVNHSPSFNIDSPLDLKIKQKVISDALILMNIHPDSRKEYEERKKKQILLRTLAHNKAQEKENKIQDIRNAQMRRALWESTHLGGFEVVFPDNEGKFEVFIQASQKIWVESTGGRLPSKDRPHTQESIHKSIQKRSPQNINEVFNRLYNTKKTKVEPPPIAPCFQLDEAFRTQYFKNESPYSFIELVVPAKSHEKARFKSMPKKRIALNNHLDDILKERRNWDVSKKKMNYNETPLQICSVLTDEKILGDHKKDKILQQLVMRKIF